MCLRRRLAGGDVDQRCTTSEPLCVTSPGGGLAALQICAALVLVCYWTLDNSLTRVLDSCLFVVFLLQAESVHYYLLNTARRGLDLIMVKIKRLWHAITNALRSPYIAKAPKAAEDGLLLGSQDLHTTILSFVDEGSEARASRVSTAWARLRGWICELAGPTLVNVGRDHRANSISAGRDNEDEDGEDSDDWEDIDEDSDGSDSPYYAYGGQESVRMGRVALYIAATGERYRMR